MSEENSQLIDNITVLRDILVDIIDSDMKLSDIQKNLIFGRFGLDGENPKKIKELSKEFDIAPAIIKKEVDNLEKILFNKLKKYI